MSEKIYVPKCNAKARTTQYGEIINVSFHAETLKAFLVEHANDKGYLNLTVSKRQKQGNYGETHSVCLDTWKPNQQGQQQQQQPSKPDGIQPTEQDMEVPF